MSDKIAQKSDWEVEDMPEKTREFILNRTFSPQDMEALTRGNIPQEMEDKWFWYMDGNRLYAHRSWSGICIYIIEFREDNNHVVTVNDDPQQYKCQDVEEEQLRLNKLLDWWSRPVYDHYGEWISETVDAINAKKQ